MALVSGYSPTPSAFWNLDNAHLVSGNPDNQINPGTLTAAGNNATTGQVAHGARGEAFLYSSGASTRTYFTSSTFELEYNTTFTLSCWFKTSSSGAFISKQENSVNYRGYSLLIDDTGYIKFELTSTQANYLYLRTNATYADNAWHHVTLTYTGTSLASGVKIYVDGSIVATTTLNDDLGSNTTINTMYFNFGRRGNGSGLGVELYYTGYLDEIGIWSGTALSAKAVLRLYNNSMGIYSMIDKPTFFNLRDSVQKQYFKMRGVDSGTSTYTSWTVDRVPDFTGALATVANTSPALSGSITANSTIISAQWRKLP